MPILEILEVPHPALKTKATAVSEITSAVKQQIQDMFDTMYKAPGIGLAANQVGLLNRVLVMHVTTQDVDTGPIAMINPEITWRSEELSKIEEGCLSIPDQYAEVERPRAVKVTFLDIEGQQQELEGQDLVSHCIQHEIDHLDGIVFLDHLSSLKRNMILKKLKKHCKKS